MNGYGSINVSGRACTLGRFVYQGVLEWFFAHEDTANCSVGLSFTTVLINNFQCKCSTKEANALLFAVKLSPFWSCQNYLKPHSILLAIGQCKFDDPSKYTEMSL